MQNKAYIWLFNDLQERKLFVKALKGGVVDSATEQLFGARLGREALYKRQLTASQLRLAVEQSLPALDEGWRNCIGVAVERGYFSGLIYVMAQLFPSGSITLSLLFLYRVIDVELNRFSATADISAAVEFLKNRLQDFDVDVVNEIDGFNGLESALRQERINAGIDVLAAMAWDFDRIGYGRLETYICLFPFATKNRRGGLKSPQRVFYEWLSGKVTEIDGYLGIERKAGQMMVDDIFFGYGGKNKYLDGVKKLSLQEYEKILEGLWPYLADDKMDEVYTYIISKIIFVMVSQGLHDEVVSSCSRDDVYARGNFAKDRFECHLEALRKDGENVLRQGAEIIRRQKGPSAS